MGEKGRVSKTGGAVKGELIRQGEQGMVGRVGYGFYGTGAGYALKDDL